MGWITSQHAIRAALTRKTPGTLYLVGRGERARDLRTLAERNGIPVRTTARAWLVERAGDRVRLGAFQSLEHESPEVSARKSGRDRSAPARSPTDNHAIDLKRWLSDASGAAAGPILALDHITDPHNFGAILRSALLLGVVLVIAPSRRSAGSSDTVARTSAGASGFVPIAWVSNLRQALDACKSAGWWVYIADTGGVALSDASIHREAVIVMGAEGKGISPAVAKVADETLTIPASAPRESGVDSFNVSVATALLLYEYRRQWPYQ